MKKKKRKRELVRIAERIYNMSKGNPDIAKYGKRFDSESGKAAGKAPKTPRAKTILKKLLKQNVPLTDDEYTKLCKVLGYKIDKKKIDHETLMQTGLLQRAKRSDESYKLLHEIVGDELFKKEEASQGNITINLNPTKPDGT